MADVERKNRLLAWIETCIHTTNKVAREIQIARENLTELQTPFHKETPDGRLIRDGLARALQKAETLQADLVSLYEHTEHGDL